MKNFTTKIKQKLWLYSFIKTLVLFGQSILIVLSIISFFYLLFTFPITVIIILFTLSFLFIWALLYIEEHTNVQKEISKKLEQEKIDRLKKYIEELTDEYYKNKEHTQEEKEEYQKKLLKKALGKNNFIQA